MTNFDNFSNIMKQYLLDRGINLPIVSNVSRTSSSDTGEPLCDSAQPVIDMDTFARKGYRKIILPDSVTENDSINTADAFLINSQNEWYFIEFKDRTISNSSAKISVLKKAYSNIYAVFDVLYSMRKTVWEYRDFDYGNPIDFIRKNVCYVLVFRAEKNPQYASSFLKHKRIGERYLPEFMRRLQGYIYKEAYAMTEDEFQKGFLKKFRD